MREGLPYPNIAEIEGLEYFSASRLCREIAKKYNIKVAGRGGKSCNADQIGLTASSAKLRSNLGSIIYDMHNNRRIPEDEVARRTGLTIAEQRKAKSGSKQNWKLSQMERLAESEGRDFRELLLSCMFSVDDLPFIIETLVPHPAKQSRQQREKVQCSISLLNSLR